MLACLLVLNGATHLYYAAEAREAPRRLGRDGWDAGCAHDAVLAADGTDASRLG